MSVPEYETERNRVVIGNPIAARFFDSGNNGARTHDLLVVTQTLSQLSYVSATKKEYHLPNEIASILITVRAARMVVRRTRIL
jgi:hypothetical protein